MPCPHRHPIPVYILCFLTACGDASSPTPQADLRDAGTGGRLAPSTNANSLTTQQATREHDGVDTIPDAGVDADSGGETGALAMTPNGGPSPGVVINPSFETGAGGDADGWAAAQYAPSQFATQGDVDVVGPGCGEASAAVAGFESLTARTEEAAFTGSAAMELRAGVDCALGGQFRWRSAATQRVTIPAGDGYRIGFWTRIAGQAACERTLPPETPAQVCLPFSCDSTNYDAEHVLGVLFDDFQGQADSRQRLATASHGPHVGSCFAHVTETIANGDSQHPWFTAARDSQMGADGETWFRYSVAVPANYVGPHGGSECPGRPLSELRQLGRNGRLHRRRVDLRQRATFRDDLLAFGSQQRSGGHSAHVQRHRDRC